MFGHIYLFLRILSPRSDVKWFLLKVETEHKNHGCWCWYVLIKFSERTTNNEAVVAISYNGNYVNFILMSMLMVYFLLFLNTKTSTLATRRKYTITRSNYKVRYIFLRVTYSCCYNCNERLWILANVRVIFLKIQMVSDKV